MSSTAIFDICIEIKYLKRMRDRYDVEEDGVLYYEITDETIAEYHRKYAYFCKLLIKARNYLWNISPNYRDCYSGEFDTIMAVF